MAVRKFHKNRFKSSGQNLSRRVILIREKKLIKSNYDFLKCTIKQNKLICKGIIKPTEYSKEYSIRIDYEGINSPKVYLIEPEIEYHDDIHIYPKEKNLCLYHPETDNFFWDYRKHNIFDTIIPWTLEWFVYYELYLITGKWEHPFKAHRRVKDDN
ncbi:hypothetical protein P700755_000210 [Psychroflexus torquis ATCC 700755]|uniref:Type II CBASS E2 protein domain-containing protein n=1 Tax=Psychroflexus torquis (strain ATCC 700755 / CIP 106069 / ACAM 623) TaxID=313595 RepID=K4IA14_PSYTT|nr:hypothetical protein [Psychroflexus torquis]AFU67264.1 hypothetical protein P700755_000210 [Psychroflexus torquis ATCC 700755]